MSTDLRSKSDAVIFLMQEAIQGGRSKPRSVKVARALHALGLTQREAHGVLTWVGYKEATAWSAIEMVEAVEMLT